MSTQSLLEALLKRQAEIMPEFEKLASEEKMIRDHLELLNSESEIKPETVTDYNNYVVGEDTSQSSVKEEVGDTEFSTNGSSVVVDDWDTVKNINSSEVLSFIEEHLDPTDFTIMQYLDEVYPLANAPVRRTLYQRISTVLDNSPRVIRYSRGRFAFTSTGQTIKGKNISSTVPTSSKITDEAIEDILASDTTKVDKLARYAALNGGMLHVSLVPKEFGTNVGQYISTSPRFRSLARGVYQLTAPIFGKKNVSKILIDIYDTACQVGGTFSPQLLARELTKREDYADRSVANIGTSVAMMCTKHSDIFDHPTRGTYKLRV